MALSEVLHTLLSDTRNNVRIEMVNLFLNEVAGTGNRERTSKYNYTVEMYENYKIIIKRPGNLNKGFDFIVDIEGIKFKNARNNGYHAPSHKDIMNALNQIKIDYLNQYDNIKLVLNKLFVFEIPDLSLIKNIKYKDYLNQEHPVATILLAIKWLFIEQDITYWNWSGRNMLKLKLESVGLM